MKRSPSLKPVSQLEGTSRDTHVHSRRTGNMFTERFQKHDICFLFAFKWDSLPLLERSPAKQESILPLKDQQPGFRGQRPCSHSRLHSQQIYRPLYPLTVTFKIVLFRFDSLKLVENMFHSCLILIRIHAFLQLVAAEMN